MSRYTLKVFYNTKELEKFEHRPVSKLRIVLSHPRFSYVPERFSNDVVANRFEISDSMRTCIFNGNLTDAIAYIRKLK